MNTRTHKAMEFVKEHWVAFLAVMAVISFLLNVVIFYPGYMSNDSIFHLLRSEHLIPLNDVQPPIQDLLWRVLIHVTGHVSAMLLCQLALLWGALLLLAKYVFHGTGSYKLSLAPILIGFLPFVINISGVIWSDTQLAFSFLMAVMLVLCMRQLSDKRIRYPVAIISFVLIVYGCLVRGNGFIAVAPLLYLLLKEVVPKITSKILVIAFVGCVLLILGANQLVKVIVHPQHVTSTSLFMLDDVVHVNTAHDLERASIAPGIKSSLIKANACVYQHNIAVGAYWECLGSDRGRFLTTDSKTLQSLWIHTVLHKPMAYVGYKIETFALVLFPMQGHQYVWQDGITPNTLNLSPKFAAVGRTTEIYVMNFGYKHFSFFYEPWFWLMLMTVVLWWSLKLSSERKMYIICLCASGILYILGYGVTGITIDYRYIYWPVLATLVCLVLGLMDYRTGAVAQKNKKAAYITRRSK